MASSSSSKPSNDESTTSVKHSNNLAIIAPIPWHSHVLMASLLAFFVATFPSPSEIDEVATEATFTRILFPQYVSLSMLIAIRLLFSAIILLDCLYAILWGSWDQDTEYYEKESKLITIRALPFRGILLQSDFSVLRGMLTMASFTMWSWLLLGISFGISGSIGVMVLNETEPASPWLLRAGILLFECAAPTTLLVSVVVKYVLWPMSIDSHNNNNSNVLAHPLSLLEHNGNIFMAFAEICLLGGLPIRLDHISVAPLFGIAYVYFTWFMKDKWASAELYGDQFIYPFFDTTLGWTATISLLILLLVLTASYGLFCIADYVLVDGGNNSIVTHLLAMVIMMFCACRFRD